MEQSRSYKIIGIILTVILSVMTVSNYSGYTNANKDSELLRADLKTAFSQQQLAYEDVPEMQSRFEGFNEQLENKLVPNVYRQKSLYRLIGCIVSLFGIALLRNGKFIGFHLFLGGMAVGILAAFYTFGFGMIGWLFNVTYILFTAAVSIYYYTKKKYLM
ncbi:hypothetical protein N9772_01530 [Bacteroidia bacterium]|nr:hypothetical protein [Bacteroidia bacterium]